MHLMESDRQLSKKPKLSVISTSVMQVPPTRMAKSSKNDHASTPDVVPKVMQEQQQAHAVAASNNGDSKASAATASTALASDPAPASLEQTQARVVSVTQAMVKGEITAHTGLSSQWFRHPDCGLGIWWRLCGELKDGRIEVNLVTASSDKASPVDIVVCAVQVRVTVTTASGTVSTATVPFKEATTVLKLAGTERTLVGGATECGGVDSLLITMTIGYMALPEYLTCKELSSGGTSAMFDNKEFGAVNIVLDSGEEVLAHKAVLASQSAMLKTMFAGTLQSPTPTRLYVTAVSMDVLTTMLRYLYTGVVQLQPNADRESTVSLLYLAERFGLIRLKQYAELALVDFLQSAESELLQMSMTTHAEFLKQVILVRLSILAGFNSCADKGMNKEANVLTEVLASNSEMLQNFFRLSTIAMSPIFKPFSLRDAKTLTRSST